MIESVPRDRETAITFFGEVFHATTVRSTLEHVLNFRLKGVDNVPLKSVYTLA